MIPALLIAAVAVATNANGTVTCSSPYSDPGHPACTGLSFTVKAELRDAKPDPSGRKPGLHRLREMQRRRREAAQTNQTTTATAQIKE